MSNASRQPRSSNRPDQRTTGAAVTRQNDISITHAHLIATVIPHPAREQLIRESAFHHAEARGFESGHELEDWLAAEAEVDERLSGEGRAY